ELDGRGLPGVRFLQPIWRYRVDVETSRAVQTKLNLQIGKVEPARVKDVLNAVVSHGFERVTSLLAPLNAEEVLESLLITNEAYSHPRALNEATLSGRSQFAELNGNLRAELLRDGAALAPLGRAIRFLIELVAQNPPRGQGRFSLGLFDQLAAFVV